MSKSEDRFRQWVNSPFVPRYLCDQDAKNGMDDRIADAVEYIAAQLGEIIRKMDHIGSAGTTRDDFDRMNELLNKL